MPVVTIKGKKTHFKYPENWNEMTAKQKAMYIRSKKMKMEKKKPKKKK